MLNRTVISVMLSLCSLISYGQGRDMSKIKSKILQAQSEKEKIEGFLELGMAFGRQYPDSVLYYHDSLKSEYLPAVNLLKQACYF